MAAAEITAQTTAQPAAWNIAIEANACIIPFLCGGHGRISDTLFYSLWDRHGGPLKLPLSEMCL